MRIISWNVHGALSDSPVWDFLSNLQPDLALLQEIGALSKRISGDYDCSLRTAVSRHGRPQRFKTGVLVRGKKIANIALRSQTDWINRELEFFQGNLVACTVQPEGYDPIDVISVHSPAWPVNAERLEGLDVAWLKSASTNPYLWAADILWDALRNNAISGGNWVIGGDFNCSETFDYDWQTRNKKRFGIRSSGNAETLRRMRGLGLTECLRRTEEDPIVPTFRHSRGGIHHQMDHLFVSQTLAVRLEKCSVGDQSVVFDGLLSDHLPIIADFKAEVASAKGAD